MKKNLVIFSCLFLGLSTHAQNFQNYYLETDSNDFFADFVEVGDAYFISGLHSRYNINKNINFIVKLSLDGKKSDIIYLDTMKTNREICLTAFYNNYFYNVYRDSCFQDTNFITICKIDSNGLKVEEKHFPSIKGVKLGASARYEIYHNVLELITLAEENTNLSFIDLDSLKLIKQISFNDNFRLNDYIFDSTRQHYYFVAYDYNGLKWFQVLIDYDDQFNKLDTLLIKPRIGNFSNITRYKDSLYIISGKELNPQITTNYFFELQLRVLNSDLQTVNWRSYKYNDSIALYSGYVQNLVRTTNNEYYLGGFAWSPTNMYDTLGVVVFKLDSNLNVIWKKHIPGNSYNLLYRMKATVDGGVVMLVNEWPSYPGEVLNAAFIKVGSNGEISSIKRIFNFADNIQIFPNPAKEAINISVPDGIKIKRLTLYNIEGKVIKEEKMNISEPTLDIVNLHVGVYIIRGILSNGNSFSRKIIKE